MEQQKPQVKVWQPQGFEGLEVIDVVSSKEPVVRTSLESYLITVGLVGPAYISYRGSKQDGLKGPLFSVYQAGEVLSSGPTEVVWSFRSVRLAPELIQGVVTDLGHVLSSAYFPDAHVDDKRLNLELSTLVYNACQSFLDPTSTLERESRLLNLISKVIRHCAEDPPPERCLGQEHQAVGLMKGFLREHFQDNVTLTDLAALTGLSRDHLIRVFARDVDITPHVYQTNLRVYKAKRLLAAGTSIAETALLTGFSDQSHLHHTFKKYVMVTPGEYRRASAPQKVLTSG